MDNDKAFFGTVLAMLDLFAGHPGWAFLIFLIAVM